MKTLNVYISDNEFRKFGFNNTEVNFTDLLDLISKELARQRLELSLNLADKYGLSDMNMSQISKEVKSVRDETENRN